MDNYIIENSTVVEGMDTMVYSTNYKCPIGYIKEIERDLEPKPQTVLFDLLLSNGTASNRFVTGYFDGKQFDYKSFKNLDSDLRNDVLREKSSKFYQSHPLFVEASILLTPQKKLILKGMKLR